MFRILATLAGGLVTVLAPVGPAAPAPAAAACAEPTGTIGGLFTGEDDRSVGGLVGLTLFTADGTSIGMDGCPRAVGEYAAVDRVNEHPDNPCCFVLPSWGALPDTGERRWQVTGIPSNAVRAFVEAYPKSAAGDSANGFTDYSWMGGQLYRSAPITTDVDIRLPLNCGFGERPSSNNGSIAARITIGGQPADVAYVVAFSRAAEGTGQILGFVASTQTGARGEVIVPALEPNQRYALEINLRDGRRFWFEHDYGYGVPVRPCERTVRTFVLDAASGRAIDPQAMASAPAAADVGGTAHVYFRGGDSSLRGFADTGTVPVAGNLGGGVLGEPDVASWGPGRVDLVVRGLDGQVWWGSADTRSGGWRGWRPLGGLTAYSPAITSWAPGRLDVVVTGIDGQVWHRFTADGGSTWSGWAPIGGVLTSAPDVTTWGTDRLDVVGRGTDGAVWHLAFAGTWVPWESLGGRLADAPAVSAPAFNRLDVVARGGADQVFTNRWDGAAYTGWWWLGGGRTDGEPEVAAGRGVTRVYVRGPDGVLYRATRSSPDGAYAGWVAVRD